MVKSAKGIQARVIRDSDRSPDVFWDALGVLKLLTDGIPGIPLETPGPRGRQKRMTITPAAMLATDATMSTSSKPT